MSIGKQVVGTDEVGTADMELLNCSLVAFSELPSLMLLQALFSLFVETSWGRHELVVDD